MNLALVCRQADVYKKILHLPDLVGGSLSKHMC